MMSEEAENSGVPEASTAASKPLFRDLDADVDLDELETSEIESLCMRCYKEGVTRLLLTKIPMFHEVIISSFECPHCGERNSEIQPGAPLQDKGVRFTLTVKDTRCLNRMVVRSDVATVSIPELEFEVPPQKGQITTVESIIQQAIANLELEQPYRMEVQPEVAKQIEAFLVKLKDCLLVKNPFTVVVDDPVGNSFVQGELGEEESCLTVQHYQRSTEQEEKFVGGSADTQQGGDGAPGDGEPGDGVTGEGGVPGEGCEGAEAAGEVGPEEVVVFRNNCPNCNSPVETRMKLVDIPHFKQVIIMATNCDACGHHSNEVKSGTGVSEHGTRIKLKLTDTTDLSRDILKAETALLLIPELGFELLSGTLGGRFTTVEGLLVQARDQLVNSLPFSVGDSADEGSKSKLQAFVEEMNEVINGKRLDVHIILDDPAGNSYIQNVYAPEPDPNMTVEHYQRSFEQNEVLGLNDMKTENYSTEQEEEEHS